MSHRFKTKKMEWINSIIASVNDVLWSYVLTIMLIGCALWFTFRGRFLQFRMVKEMVRLLGDSKPESKNGEKHISSFQAFAVSIASRVGTGNLAGLATAIAIGGPGAVFWMWLIALLGSSSAFVESTLAQLYKTRGEKSFVGGPAYYMQQGLGKRWMGILFAVLISITFGFAFNSVQSNTICAAWENSFGIDPFWMGVGLTVVTLCIIFGGVHRIANVSGVIVPVMAIGYILLALFVVLSNIQHIPSLIATIVGNAFGWEQAFGGGVAAALVQGMKRGLFSNEAGMGSAPNVAATAHVSHPVKQGLIQALGVFTDTLIICTCTAFIILLSDTAIASNANGIQLTQSALESEVGRVGNVFPVYDQESHGARCLPSAGGGNGDVRRTDDARPCLGICRRDDGADDYLQPCGDCLVVAPGVPAARKLSPSEAQRREGPRVPRRRHSRTSWQGRLLEIAAMRFRHGEIASVRKIFSNFAPGKTQIGLNSND